MKEYAGYCHFANDIVITVGDVEIAGAVRGYPACVVQIGAGCRAAIAGVPSGSVACHIVDV